VNEIPRHVGQAWYDATIRALRRLSARDGNGLAGYDDLAMVSSSNLGAKTWRTPKKSKRSSSGSPRRSLNRSMKRLTLTASPAKAGFVGPSVSKRSSTARSALARKTLAARGSKPNARAAGRPSVRRKLEPSDITARAARSRAAGSDITRRSKKPVPAGSSASLVRVAGALKQLWKQVQQGKLSAEKFRRLRAHLLASISESVSQGSGAPGAPGGPAAPAQSSSMLPDSSSGSVSMVGGAFNTPVGSES